MDKADRNQVPNLMRVEQADLVIIDRQEFPWTLVLDQGDLD